MFLPVVCQAIVVKAFSAKLSFASPFAPSSCYGCDHRRRVADNENDSGSRGLTDHLSAARGQLEAVAARMTLPMEDALALQHRQFRFLNRTEAAAACLRNREVVAVPPKMDRDTLFPTLRG